MTQQITLDPSIADPIKRLGDADRNLVANALADSVHLVDDDMGEDPSARHAAYKALAALVRNLR